jgi:hypothetical protein
MATKTIPPPPPAREPAFEPPRINSVYNLLVRRLRMARTIFDDRVKLSLRQIEDDHYTRLARPYLIVVPRQVRAPRPLGDNVSFVDPREVMLVAQFEDRMSEASHLAANDIDTAEAQLVYVLGNWQPTIAYRPTLYAGMRIQSTRAPDVKVAYTFLLYETVVLPDVAPEFDPNDIPVALQLERIGIHINDPFCCGPECEPACPTGPRIEVSAGGCRAEPESDPCAEDLPAPILGGDNAAPQTQRR